MIVFDILNQKIRDFLSVVHYFIIESVFDSFTVDAQLFFIWNLFKLFIRFAKIYVVFNGIYLYLAYKIDAGRFISFHVPTV